MPLAQTADTDFSAQVASIAEQLNRLLLDLDRLKIWNASSHLSLAIEALPGQRAILPPVIDESN